jgi:hypothetical protein
MAPPAVTPALARNERRETSLPLRCAGDSCAARFIRLVRAPSILNYLLIMSPVFRDALMEINSNSVPSPSPWARFPTPVAAKSSPMPTHTRGSVAPFSGTAEQSNLSYFLSRAGAHLDIERGGEPVGGRKLLAGGRESDVGGPCRRIGDMLDRLRAEMACNAGGKSSAQSAGELCARRSHHRRASKVPAAAGAPKRARHPLDRPIAVRNSATVPRSGMLTVGAFEDCVHAGR